MIDSEFLLKQIQTQNKNVTIEDINKIINEQDRDLILTTQIKRYRYEIWDKKTPINGVSAEDIIKSREYEINYGFLIYLDGQLLYFQDHNPNESGYVKMTKKQAENLAQTFIEDRANENVDRIIISKVLKDILKEG